jgi:hypothetical protein
MYLGRDPPVGLRQPGQHRAPIGRRQLARAEEPFNIGAHTVDGGMGGSRLARGRSRTHSGQIGLQARGVARSERMQATAAGNHGPGRN